MRNSRIILFLVVFISLISTTEMSADQGDIGPLHLIPGANKINVTTPVVMSTATIPSEVNVVFEGEGSLIVNDGVKVVILGEVTTTKKKIFTGNGTVFLNSQKNSIVYPEWWGAKGDGHNDDTAAIQSSIDSIDYGTVSLSGKYRINELRLKSGITLSGSGFKTITGSFEIESGTQLIYSGTGVAISMEGIGTDYIERARIQHIAVTDPYKKGISAIRTFQARYCEINDLYVNGFQTGIDYNKFSWLNKVRQVQVFASRKYGLKIEAQGEDTLFEASIFRYCGVAGCFMSYSSKTNAFIECDFSNNPIGIDVYSSSDLLMFFTLMNCHFEDCDRAAIHVNSKNKAMKTFPSFTIIGSRFRSSEGHKAKFPDAVAIEIEKVNKMTIIGCVNLPGYDTFLLDKGYKDGVGNVIIMNTVHDGKGELIKNTGNFDHKENFKIF